MKKVENITIWCDCMSHSLQVNRIDDECDSCFEISLWKYGHISRPLNFFQRIRWMWRILWSGNPWADSVILNDCEAKELSKFIERNTKSEDFYGNK